MKVSDIRHLTVEEHNRIFGSRRRNEAARKALRPAGWVYGRRGPRPGDAERISTPTENEETAP